MNGQLTTEEQAAFAERLEPHHEYLARFCNRLCRCDDDGRDLYQQAILKALVKRDSLRDCRRFRQWLCSIIINEHRSRCRRERLRRLLGLAPRPRQADDRPAADEPATVPPDPDRAIRVRRCLQRLSPAKREAVVLFEVEGLTLEEVAAVQQISLSAAKTRVSRARRELRALYESGTRPEPGASRAEQVNRHEYGT
jgi:RNA polymerase sigma-70 factor (ECF subfamily)